MKDLIYHGRLGSQEIVHFDYQSLEQSIKLFGSHDSDKFFFLVLFCLKPHDSDS